MRRRGAAAHASALAAALCAAMLSVPAAAVRHRAASVASTAVAPAALPVSYGPSVGMSGVLVVRGLPSSAYSPALIQDAVGAAVQSLLPSGAPLAVDVTTTAYAAAGTVVLQGA
jgi:hypothetical protein